MLLAICGTFWPSVKPARSVILTLKCIGKLSEVMNLELELVNDSTVRITWAPPFTLDITDVDPDIVGYQVNVQVIHHTREHMPRVINHGSTTELNYIYSLPNNGCYIYTFTVTPFNRVGDGMRSRKPYVGNRASMPTCFRLNMFMRLNFPLDAVILIAKRVITVKGNPTYSFFMV